MLKPAWEQYKEEALRVYILAKANLNRRMDQRGRQQSEEELESYRTKYREAGAIYGDSDVGMVRWYFERSLSQF